MSFQQHLVDHKRLKERWENLAGNICNRADELRREGYLVRTLHPDLTGNGTYFLEFCGEVFRLEAGFRVRDQRSVMQVFLTQTVQDPRVPQPARRCVAEIESTGSIRFLEMETRPSYPLDQFEARQTFFDLMLASVVASE